MCIKFGDTTPPVSREPNPKRTCKRFSCRPHFRRSAHIHNYMANLCDYPTPGVQARTGRTTGGDEICQNLPKTRSRQESARTHKVFLIQWHTARCGLGRQLCAAAQVVMESRANCRLYTIYKVQNARNYLFQMGFVCVCEHRNCRCVCVCVAVVVAHFNCTAHKPHCI